MNSCWALNFLLVITATAASTTRKYNNPPPPAEPDSVLSPIDCEGHYADFSACSSSNTRTSHFEMTKAPVSSGRPCPEDKTETCAYDGPRSIVINGDAGWKIVSRRDTEAEIKSFGVIKATVGDTLVFRYAGASDVYKVLSLFHFAECDFADGGLQLAGVEAGGDGFRYTIPETDKNQRLYLASSQGIDCSQGLRVLVDVDNFRMGTLTEGLQHISEERFKTTGGANALIERLWCMEDHCPQSALAWYFDDPSRAEIQCRPDAFNLLGFVYRKKPSPDTARAEKYYKKALEIYPEHCETVEYLGELYLETSDLVKATETYNQMIRTQEQRIDFCSDVLAELRTAWRQKGWCLPPNQKTSPCATQSMTVTVSLPLTELQFGAEARRSSRKALYIGAFASAAAVPLSDVLVSQISVDFAGGGIKVPTTIVNLRDDSATAAVRSRLTLDNLNTNLESQGLPLSTRISEPTVYVDDTSNASSLGGGTLLFHYATAIVIVTIVRLKLS